jgi:hypothetical protein
VGNDTLRLSRCKRRCERLGAIEQAVHIRDVLVPILKHAYTISITATKHSKAAQACRH